MLSVSEPHDPSAFSIKGANFAALAPVSDLSHSRSLFPAPLSLSYVRPAQVPYPSATRPQQPSARS